MSGSSLATESRATRLMWTMTGCNEKADTVAGFEYKNYWDRFLEDFKQLSWAFPEEEFDLEETLWDDTGGDFWRTTWTLKGGEVL